MPAVPTAAELKLRYPAFDAVDDAVVTYWITDAQRIVTTSWSDGDYQPGIMALAAHNMSLQGLGGSGGAVADIAALGVTDFRSASLSVSFDADTVKAGRTGGYSATRYGAEFAVMLRRNVGGPMLVGCAA